VTDVSLLDHSTSLPEVTRQAGEILIMEGDAVSELFVLVRGTVVVERDDVAVARINTQGAMFGEMSLLLRKPATATVRCESDVVLRVSDDPETFLVQQPAAALEVARVLAGRVDGLTQYLVDVKHQYSDLEGHLGMLDTVLGALTYGQRPRARPGSVRDPQG
jgi:CRP/FNR family cyclic AMP-dependent transcriptional regulator